MSIQILSVYLSMQNETTMKALNTYTLENNGVTVTIENKKRYWKLSVASEDRIIIISNDSKIWNTLRGAKAFANTLLSNY